MAGPVLQSAGFQTARSALNVALSMAAADGVCQAIESYGETDPPDWDSQRTLRMSATGGLVMAPLLEVSLRAAERLFPGQSKRSVFGKMAFRVLWAPINISAVFGASTAIKDGSTGPATREKAWHKIRSDLPSTMAVGMLYWPWIDFLTFRYIKNASIRPSVIGLAAAGWNVFLCAQANRAAE